MKSEAGGGNAFYLKSLATCLHKITGDGYTDNFVATANGFRSYSTNKTYLPEEIKIINSFWFESNVSSDQDKTAALHLIETRDGNKGTLVDTGNTLSALKLMDTAKQQEK